MIGKAVLSGLWVCPECRSLDVFFTLDHVSVFASKCQGECHAVKAALCDLGDPGWGDPWFPHWALLLPAPFSGPWCVCGFSLLSCVMGLRNMTHKLSSAYAEMILSYHLLPQQIFFTHNWNLSRHCCVVVCFLFVFCVVCFCVCLFFVLFLLLVLCVSVLVLW